jgi:hypothetical protein
LLFAIKPTGRSQYVAIHVARVIVRRGKSLLNGDPCRSTFYTTLSHERRLCGIKMVTQSRCCHFQHALYNCLSYWASQSSKVTDMPTRAKNFLHTTVAVYKQREAQVIKRNTMVSFSFIAQVVVFLAALPLVVTKRDPVYAFTSDAIDVFCTDSEWKTVLQTMENATARRRLGHSQRKLACP